MDLWNRMRARWIVAACCLAAITILRAGEPAGDVQVRVLLHTSSGEVPLSTAYIALVPPYRPWSRPVAETITNTGAAVFTVPPGLYRIVAGAADRGVTYQMPTRIAAKEKNELILSIPDRQSIAGTVRDEHGAPLSKATIADASALMQTPVGRLSRLGIETLGTRWKTASAEDGSWSLALPLDSRNPLVAETDGYGVVWQALEPGKTYVDLVLKPGGALALTLDRADPEFLITLSSRGPVSVPASWQPQYWARAVSKPLLEWRSLPPADYDIYAQQPDPRTFSGRIKVGSVSIAGGSRTELRVSLPPARPRSENFVVWFVEGAARDTLERLQAFGRDSAGAPRVIPYAFEQVTGGTLLYLNAAQVGPPFFVTTTDRLIFSATEGDPSVPSRAFVHELGQVSLRVRAGGKDPALPSAGTAVFERCERNETVTIPVEVKKDGTVSFPAPANCASLVLRFDPFGPLRFPGPILPGTPRSLGEVTLHAAGGRARARSE